MESINLIPQEERVQQNKTKVVKLTTVLAIVLLIVIILVSFYYFYVSSNIKKQIEAYDLSISQLRMEINKHSQVEINARNLFKKSQTLQNIFNTRSIYSFLLSELNSSLPGGVSIDSFGFGKESSITISGWADNYNQVQELSNNILEKDLFVEVQLNSVSLDNSRNKVNYFLVVRYNKEVLYGKN